MLKQPIERSLEAPTYKDAINGVVYEAFRHKELILEIMVSQRRKEMEILF